MEINSKKVFYLSAKHVSSESCVYSATFADMADVHECFILANSLAEAVYLIYSELSSTFSAEFINSTLLELKFVKRIDVIDPLSL